MQEFLYDFILGSKFKFLSGWIILNYWMTSVLFPMKSSKSTQKK
jgi:hypothetical protein